jgi:hypothetical protein
MLPNFALLDMSHPEVVSLVAAMLQARDAVDRRSWSHPQEPTGEEWWADVLADPRARKRERRTDLAVKQAFYRLAGPSLSRAASAIGGLRFRATS